MRGFGSEGQADPNTDAGVGSGVDLDRTAQMRHKAFDKGQAVALDQGVGPYARIADNQAHSIRRPRVGNGDGTPAVIRESVAYGVGHQLMNDDGQWNGMAFGQQGGRCSQFDSQPANFACLAPETGRIVQIGAEIDEAVLGHTTVDQAHGRHDITEPGEVTAAFRIAYAAKADSNQRLQQLIPSRHTAFELADPEFRVGDHSPPKGMRLNDSPSGAEPNRQARVFGVR